MPTDPFKMLASGPLRILFCYFLQATYTVVHDGSQAHNAHVYVIPLAGGRLLMHFAPKRGAYSVIEEHRVEERGGSLGKLRL